jgi:DNA modification methylase
LRPSQYNPRQWDKEAKKQLRQSIAKFGLVDPLLVNSAKSREGVVIGGHFRLAIAKELGYEKVPVVYICIDDLEKEKELNIRLNKNLGEFDWDMLANFGDSLLSDIGFSSEEMDNIFGLDETPEIFDLEKELKKLNINKIEIQKGDVWQLGNNRLMCGQSTVEADMLKLMNGEKADMCFTDPPYILDYLKGKKKNGEAITGFGYKRDRRYLETDILPPDFTESWMANIAKVAKTDFSIIVYENWKNIRTIWGEMEKYWKVKNMIVWHLPNRVQGFAAKYKFFNKHDIAMVGQSGIININILPEDELLQNEYETALYATSGKPHWESYEKGKKYCPTDFLEYKSADKKNSGQGIIFGTKPLEILIPYIKVLTKRDALIVEPFGGSGSTLIAAQKMNRRCFLMEKSPIYAEVIRKRWENLTNLKAKKYEDK